MMPMVCVLLWFTTIQFTQIIQVYFITIGTMDCSSAGDEVLILTQRAVKIAVLKSISTE